jgi:cytochrome d ubiquinol oxidase subunit I
VSAAQILFSLAGFILFYSALLIVDLVLMGRYIYMGPVKALGLEGIARRSRSPVPAE